MRHLAITAALVRFCIRVIPRDWYRRFPFLPVPRLSYFGWRFHTAYGARRPSWRVVLADLWQFGGWLADADGRLSRPS